MHTMLAISALLVASGPFEPGDHRRSVRVENRMRSYLMHVPPSYNGSTSLPLVLAFHGGGTNERWMANFSGLNEKADDAGFIVVYPRGSGTNHRVLFWNGGNCCGYAEQRGIDDVAYVRALLDDLPSVLRIDDKRIYVTGMSNGAIMAYRLASDLSDRIAAVAAVGGPMGTESCDPKRPVPVIHFHGTDDPFVPFEGGLAEKNITDTKFYSVEHSIQAWVRANHCPPEPKITSFPDEAEDGTRVIRKVYGPGIRGSEVVLFVIEGGGHTWPGRKTYWRFLGTSTEDISANDLMWEFFEKHPMR